MIHKYLILLILLTVVPAQATDSLGRLFLTPEQRTQLDLVRVKRDQRQPPATEPEHAITAAPVPQGPSVLIYNGMVRRSDGKSTVWINGKPIAERNRIGAPSEVNVLGMRNDGAVSVAIPQAARTASLMVGQSMDVNSGRVEEAYVRRGTTAHLGENAPNAPLAGGVAAPALRGSLALSSSKEPAKARREGYYEYRDLESGVNTPQPSEKN